MDDKTKLYVFARKEAVLILLFFVVAAFISFLFGMAVGQNISFGLNNFTHEEQRIVEDLAEENAEDKPLLDLQSGAEEDAQKIVEEQSTHKDLTPEDVNVRLEHQIEKEMSDTPASDMQAEKKNELNGQDAPEEAMAEEKVEPEVAPTAAAQEPATNSYSGKYTIVVGSYRSEPEAQEFAAGFKARGYQPIINQIEVPERGTWFRVSLGLFDNVTQAKEYMKKEDTLFQGQDSFFYKFE